MGKKTPSIQVLQEVEDKAAYVFSWFSANYFKANPKISRFFLTLKAQVNLNLDELIIKNSKSEKLLGMNNDSSLAFKSQVSKLCEKTSQKLDAIAHNSSYVTKKASINNEYIFLSEFGYYPVLKMFYNRR